MSISPVTHYQSLNEQTAKDLAVSLNYFPQHSELNCREIGDGNLNLVFHIYESGQKGIIVKQALPYAKVVGESWPLTIERARIEANALKLQRIHAKDFVPEVFYSDDRLAITVMEDLSSLRILRSALIEGEDFPHLSDHIGTFLANTLYHTSDYALHPFKKKEYVKAFSNPELCKITEDLVFTDPFFNSDSNDFEEELLPAVNDLWNDFNLKLEVAKLKKSFVTETEALLHGDLHTGSIFADKNQTKVIDPEFAFYGPIGFDIGQFLANLIFQVIARDADEARDEIIFHITNTWKVFSEQFSILWKESGDAYTKVDGYLEYILEKAFRDSIGFGGCELIRRTIGLAHVADLDSIDDREYRYSAKLCSLALGRELILRRHTIANMEELIDTVLKNVSQGRDHS
ncbi:S-methyl-5-thioribose kinase [Rossellomorea aquimaris]|uniref:S-methyl-5-thioribose kinase n=1 Tax=Rossellomorea aquimaris TaxID=189382 RepID=UPI001CD19F9A|nr:S-methyl-5-thioribose kinase [Rossellomorea aquimaris]MCA1056656.1 S-methyl-5-thioribose kinase [Rossellomorea aquimaris]